MNIVIEYDASAANAPPGFKAAVEAAVQFYDYLITDPITVPIVFSYGEIQGQAISKNAAAQSSTNGNVETFASLKNLLTAAATSATDQASLAAMATVDPTNGGAFWVSDAQARVFGLGSEPGYTDPEDGFVGISSSLNFSWDPLNRAVAGAYDAVGALEHEIAEVLGRYSYLGGSGSFNGKKLYAPLDLFRYTSPGVHSVSFSGGNFSVDGQTMLLPFNNPNSGGDGGDWDSSVVGDSYGSAYNGVAGFVSPTDLQVMDVLGYQIAALGNPVAGAAPVVSAVNGAAASIADATLTGLITNDYLGALSIVSASLDAGSAGAGVLTVDKVDNTIVFTPAAGFAGTVTGTVTISDNNGGTVNQPFDVNVVVQASAPLVTPPNTTSTTVNGNVTTIKTFSPTGTLISTETITVNANTTQTQFFDATGVQTAASIKQVNGNVTQLQNFDGSWRQLNASITTDNGAGNTIVQTFDGAWNQTGATVTSVNGAATIVQNFNPSWVQLSASITTVNGAVTETQNFDANWNQTSANLTTNLGGGVVESQNFDASWAQTSATLTTHPTANQTEIQNFNASWQQTSATIASVAGGQTTTQSFNGSWVFQGATIDTPNPDAALADRLDSYGANWVQLTEVETFLNGGKSYFTYGQPGGGQTFALAAAHSTTLIFTPGQVAGDTISGLHSLNLGGSIHDVIDFEGYGAGAHLVQVDATHYQVVSTGHATESFTLTGGADLLAGDYAFVAAGTVLNNASVGGSSGAGVITVTTGSTSPATGIVATPGGSTSPTGGASIGDAAAAASAALFNQFMASGLGAPSDGGAGQLLTAPAVPSGPMIAPPQQLA